MSARAPGRAMPSGRLERFSADLPVTNFRYNPKGVGRPAVNMSGAIMPGSMRGNGPAAPASTVSNILASVWGGGDDNKNEHAYLSNWHDIHGRHNGRTLVAESRRLTEEIINARGNFFLALVAPVLQTNEMYITISRKEPYIMPLDNIPMQGTPYESINVAAQQTIGLQSYKGMESITSEYLQDVYYGAEALRDLSYVLSRRMLVTLVDNCAMAAVSVPWEASIALFKRLHNGAFAGHYIEAESQTFAGVNKNPKDTLHKVNAKRNMRKPVDRLIVAEGKGQIFDDALRTPKNMAYYQLAYDDETGRVIQMMFNDGEPGVGSVKVGSGSEMDVIEAPTQVSSSFDTEEEGVQRFRTYPVIGDMIQEHANLPVDQASGSVDDVDVQTWAESNTEITHPALRHEHGLKYCFVFNSFRNNKNGVGPRARINNEAEAEDADFGAEYKELMSAYNNERGAQQYLARGFDGLLDNNTPPVNSNRATRLDDLTDWRHYYPIAGVFEKKGRIEIAPPKRLEDVSLVGLNPNTLLDAAIKIAKLSNVDNFLRQSQFNVPAPQLDAMDMDAPVSQSVFSQDRTALARVNTQRDLDAVLGQLARGPGSFVEHARHIPDSHMDQFIGFYKTALGQLHILTGEQLAAGTENFNQRLSELQTLRGQAPLLTAVTRASDMAKNAPLAGWTERLFKTSEVATKAPLKGVAFSLDGALKQQPSSSAQRAAQFGANNVPLGASRAWANYKARLNADGKYGGAARLHAEAAESFNMAPNVFEVYVRLLNMPFTYWNLRRLYKEHGISLFNINRYRHRQYYEMTALTGFISDRSFITMFTHPQARSGIDYIHGMVSETIEFRSSVIPLEPETTFIFPYAFANRLMGDINCQPARNYQEAISTEPDAPSLFCTMVPKDEYNYDFPLSFIGNDIHGNKPRSKKSDTPFIKKLLTPQWLQMNGATRANPVIYDRNGVFSDIIHRSWKREYNNRTESYDPINGTGPRAETFVNASESHSVWVGQSPRFPVQLESCTYVPIEINV